MCDSWAVGTHRNSQGSSKGNEDATHDGKSKALGNWQVSLGLTQLDCLNVSEASYEAAPFPTSVDKVHSTITCDDRQQHDTLHRRVTLARMPAGGRRGGAAWTDPPGDGSLPC